MPDPIDNTGHQQRVVNTSDNTGHQQHVGQGAAAGAAAGGAFAGVPGAVVGGAFGLATDLIGYYHNKKEAKRQQEEARKNAATQYAYQRSLMAEAERYNSVQNKVSQLRQAGLSPALAFGQVGTSSVPPGSAAAPETAPRVDFPGQKLGQDFNAISQGLLSAQTSQSVAQDVVTKQIDNRYRDIRNISELQKINAEITKDLADASLSDEQRTNLQALRDANIKLMLAQAESNLASAGKFTAEKEYIEGVGSDLAVANAGAADAAAGLSRAKTKTEGTVQELNKAKTKTEETVQALNEEKVNTELSIQDLNYAARNLKNVDTERLSLDLKLKRSEVRSLERFVKQHDLPEGSVQALMFAFDEFAKGSGKGLSEFLSGTNWIHAVTEITKIFKWDKSQDDDFSKSTSNDSAPSASPSVKSEPNPENLPTTLPHHIKGIISSGAKYADYVKKHSYLNDHLSEIDKYNMDMELRDAVDQDTVFKILYKYWYIVKQSKGE